MVSESVLVKWGLKDSPGFMHSWYCGSVSESVLVKWGLKAHSSHDRRARHDRFRECPCKMRIERSPLLGWVLSERLVSESVLVKWGLKVLIARDHELPKMGFRECPCKMRIESPAGLPAPQAFPVCFRECPCKMRIERPERRQAAPWKQLVSESVLVKWGLKGGYVLCIRGTATMFQRVSL